MSTKERLEKEIASLRIEYKNNPDKQKEILDRVTEIGVLLNNMCYQCKNEPRKVNDYYCSQECNDLYYIPKERGIRHSTEYMVKKLKEMGKGK